MLTVPGSGFYYFDVLLLSSDSILTLLSIARALKFIAKTKYDGVGLRVKRLSFEPLEKYYKDPYIHTGTPFCSFNRFLYRSLASFNKRLRAHETKFYPFLTFT